MKSSQFRGLFAATVHSCCTGLAIFALGASQALAAEDHGNHADICAAYDLLTGPSALQSQSDGAWSDPATWGGRIPTRNDSVAVNHHVRLDSGAAGFVQIHGQLELEGPLDLNGSVLVCDGGSLQGTRGTLAFHVVDDRQFTGNTSPGPVSQHPDFHPSDTGLWVLPGGRLALQGDNMTSWVDADALAGSRSRSVQKGVVSSVAFQDGKAALATLPDGWLPGDQLLLVNELGESALAILESMDGLSVSYRLNEGVEPIEGHVLRVDSDRETRAVRPKIANLSRRIQILGADVSPGDVNHRAHTVFLQGSEIDVRGVEFRNLGPREKLGRYPVHWHHNGESDGKLVGNSIWQSVDDGGNRFVTMHMVSGAEIRDNVGFRSQGHGFFMEEVRETRNRLAGNLSVDVRHGEELANVDSDISSRTHHFWVRSGNEISGNVAAGNNWDGRGKGNNTPSIEGLVVLASSDNDNLTVVSDFECLGCGGVGMWTTVPDTVFERPISSYAVIAGFRDWDNWNFKSPRTVVSEPLFILNGHNELFRETGDYADSVPWASQIFLNYGEVTIRGGTLVGDVGLHAHYYSRFSIDGTLIISKTLIDPTYWETAGTVTNSVVEAENLFTKGYGGKRRASPGLIEFSQTCFQVRCRETARESRLYSSNYFTNLFPNSRADGGYSVAIRLEAEEYQSGFIRLPEVSGAKFWSITPVDKSSTGSGIIAINEKEAAWRESLQELGGFPDGFPAGEYQVSLYTDSNESSLIDTAVVVVEAGEVALFR